MAEIGGLVLRWLQSFNATTTSWGLRFIQLFYIRDWPEGTKLGALAELNDASRLYSAVAPTPGRPAAATATNFRLYDQAWMRDQDFWSLKITHRGVS
jgi:hypothetical protein